MDNAETARTHFEAFKKVGNPELEKIYERHNGQFYCFLVPPVGWVERGTGIPLVPRAHWVQIDEGDEAFMVRVR